MTLSAQTKVERWECFETAVSAKNARAAKLGEGVEFKVEVIDTWNMTVTEWPETFVTAAPGRYRVKDRNGSAIRLPATPYLLLRITRI